MKLVSPQTYAAPDRLAPLPELVQSPETGPARLLDGSQLLKIKRYVHCGMSLPSSLYPALAVMDAACGLDSHRFLFDLKTHCGQWAPIERNLLRAGDALSAFGTDFSRFCGDTSARIRALPILTQASCGDVGWRAAANRALAALCRQAQAQRRDCGRLLQQTDSFRAFMDNAILPQSDAVRAALQGLAPLELELPGCRVSVPHCGFLAEDPVVRGFVRDFQNARDDAERQRLRESFFAMVEPLWTRMFTVFSSLEETGAAVVDAAAGIRNLDVLWNAVTLYLDELGNSLGRAEETERLLLLANALDSCMDAWDSVAGYGGQLRAALAQADGPEK